LSDSNRTLVGLLTLDSLPDGQASMSIACGDMSMKSRTFENTLVVLFEMNIQESATNRELNKQQTWHVKSGRRLRDQTSNSKEGYLIVADRRKTRSIDLFG
jgi:hypothetical protein